MALSRSAALIRSREGEYSEIEGWYRESLERTVPPVDWEWDPVRVGPSWQWSNGWLLPDVTLGWGVLSWCGLWLHDKHGHPWQFTMEQARLVLWFYALDPSNDFSFHSAVVQRLKGWGKDPLAACLSMAACFAPVTFDHWSGSRPIGRDEPSAWVQIVAVSQEQTKNTLKLFPSLVSPECRAEYGVQVGKTNVFGLGDTRQIEAVTSSPMAIEGGRPTLIVRNETQNWNTSNQGHDMAGAIEGNAAKSAHGAARMLDICNAYRPGEDSVGERVREAFDATQGDDARAVSFGLLYDSLEAPAEAPLTAEAAPSVLKVTAGDAVWLDHKRIVKSIMNPANPASESRRKWYNQITATEESWADPQQFDALKQPAREPETGESVVLFLDCSKTDDATALIGACLSDGFVFTAGVWQRPPRVDDWIVDRAAVDLRIRDMCEAFDVHGLWVDPSDAREDDTGERFWDALADDWARDFADEFSRLPAVEAGPDVHLCLWDMRWPSHQKRFVFAAERCATDIVEGVLSHDGSPRLVEHVRNARRRPNRFGVGLGKEHRESRRKVDAAVAMIGARMMWRTLGARPATKKHDGRWWA